MDPKLMTPEKLAEIRWFVNEFGCHEIDGAGLLSHIAALQAENERLRRHAEELQVALDEATGGSKE